ncbi:MAG TPA: hypothetical protein VFN02_11035 [Ktedonobacteraceae bacterium]|nr:hypothetical protein [Ktedonobacteraceae bacterium]
MIDTQTETSNCLGCGHPLPPSLGPRKRLYHNAACKMRARRRQEEQQKREEAAASMRARWTGLLSETQQALEDVLQLHSVELASRVAVAVRAEIATAKNGARGTIDILNVQVRSLQGQVARLEKQIDELRDIEEVFNTDTSSHGFKAWLAKSEYHASRPGCKKLLDPSMRFSPRGSRGKYQEEMRKAYFTLDEKGDVWDAWRAMLRDERFKSYYASKSNQS